MKIKKSTKMEESIEMLIENDISLECGVQFYKCHSGEYVVHSHDWGDTNGKVGWYKEFKTFDKACKKFIKEAFGKTKIGGNNEYTVGRC